MKKQLLIISLILTGFLFPQQFPIGAFRITNDTPPILYPGINDPNTQLDVIFPLLNEAHFNWGIPFTHNSSQSYINSLLNKAETHGINIILPDVVESYSGIERYYLQGNGIYFINVGGESDELDTDIEIPLGITSEYYINESRKATSTTEYLVSSLYSNPLLYKNRLYRFTFRVKVNRTTVLEPTDSIALLEVFNGLTTTTRTLRSGDFPQNNVYYRFSMDVYNHTNAYVTDLDFPSMPNGETARLEQSTAAYPDFRVKWLNSHDNTVTFWLDNIRVDGGRDGSFSLNKVEEFFNGDLNNDIITKASVYINKPALHRFYFEDEPFYSQYFSTRIVNSQLEAAGANIITGKGLGHAAIDDFWYSNDFRRYVTEAAPFELAPDIYRFHYNDPLPSDANYTEFTQFGNGERSGLQTQIINFRNAQESSVLTRSKNWWFYPNIGLWYEARRGKSPIDREPYLSELFVQLNLALSYGAKGFMYFNFWNDTYSPLPAPNGSGVVGLINENNLQPVTNSHWGENKWEGVKNFNAKLAGELGTTLMSLTWQEAYSIHEGQPTTGYITNVKSSYLPIAETIWVQDPPTSTFVELGLFKKTDEFNNINKEYFFIVNRRTLDEEGRKIRVEINKTSSSYQNWSIKEVGTSNEWTIAPEGYFETFYQPGEGKLFKLEPVVLGGGTIKFNETLPPGTSINVKGTVTIAQNKTLTISSNSTLNVLNNSRLIVNGNLIANGTLQNKVTFDFTTPVQNGIVINNGGTASLNHTIIKNAHTAITASSPNAFSVQNSTINNCVYGIDLLNYSQGTTPLIRWNNFSVNETAISANYGNTIVIQGNTITNSTMGVYLNQTSNGNVLNNTITSNMETQPGVMFSSSYGAIRGNQISGHGNGVALIESSPKVGVNNIHHNRFHGIYSGYGSSADLLAELIRDPCSEVPLYYPVGGFNFIYENGSEAEIRRGDDDGSEIYLNTSSIQASYGCNEIFDDREETQTLPTELLMNGTYGSEEFVIYAEGNYWGGNNSLLSSRFGNLLVEYEPFNLYSNSCPLPELEQYCPIIMHTADGVVLDTLYALNTEAMMDEKSQLYSEAGKAYYTNDQITAKEKYALIINNYGTEKDAINAYWRLYKLQQESNGSIHSFRELVNNKKALTNDSVLIWTMNNLLGISLTQIEAYTEAISYYEENIQTNPESDISLNSELNIMTLSLLNGISGLGKIATSYGVSNREEYISRRKELLEKKFGKSDNQITGEQIPSEYDLYQNYPNPFNPVTTITYQIPFSGMVTLKVYDVLGKEVTTLLNEEKQAGKYSIEFNASKLSSGVYLYELRSNEYKSTKKLLLMK